MKIGHILAILCLLFAIGTVQTHSQSTASNGTSTLPFDTNLSTPAVPQKDSQSVARHMESIRKKFREKNIDAQSRRNGEIIMISMPINTLFAPNSDLLLRDAPSALGIFRQAFMHPESYRVVMAVYGDDSGDRQYTTALNERRAKSLKTAVTKLIGNDVRNPNIDYYWFGNDANIVPNNSIANRAKNRRVDVYIIPETHLIQTARR